MIRKATYRLFVALTALILAVGNAKGQHINFATFAGTNISIQSGVISSLNFGFFIKGTATVKTIALADAADFEIKAPEGYDVIVTIDAPTVLTGPSSKTIPFSLKYAYSNNGLTLANARAGATEITSGLSSVTFPIKRNAMGLPAPPPTPLDGDNPSRILASAYLFVYGSAGPAGDDTVAGNYEGTVTITVEFINDVN